MKTKKKNQFSFVIKQNIKQLRGPIRIHKIRKIKTQMQELQIGCSIVNFPHSNGSMVQWLTLPPDGLELLLSTDSGELLINFSVSSGTL